MTQEDLYRSALEYHSGQGKPGKIGVIATKPMETKEDLSLAYSPGVAAPCIEIQKDPDAAYTYTNKGNTVAVISNGTAVLGLGNLGAIASKPVMEGKAALFKKCANIDAYDIEVSTSDSEAFISAIRYLGCTWGGINLEDIRAPECFLIETKLQELLDIPVFHDDQHGTSMVLLAGLTNALEIQGKSLSKVKIVINGSGAAGIACGKLLKNLGANSIVMCDSTGVIYKGRGVGMNQWKEMFAREGSDLKSLADAMREADVFVGLSVADALSGEMVKSMAKNPIIFALANPNPEITPSQVLRVRDDAVIATGRSDYPNQVNNVMGFPYLFRGALDVRAKTITTNMIKAAAYAVALIAKEEVPTAVKEAYGRNDMVYGKNYILPTPFDARLITHVPVAVAKAAMEDGVARVNIDLDAYSLSLANLGK
jgi:malate dehydrogenase (oxaloacetate-decarboxylating)(NADP+)